MTTGQNDTTKKRTRTAAERAQERVDVLRRKIARLGEARDAARAAQESAQADLEAEQRRLDYALLDPDLPGQPSIGAAGAVEVDD